MGYNIDELWNNIDEVIGLTLIAAYPFLKKGESEQCKTFLYSRCFQILGFDILLDKFLKPHVIEVNYRPSLEFHRPRERKMKVNMIADALKIVAPCSLVQHAINARKWGWSSAAWFQFISQNREMFVEIETLRNNVEKQTKFHLVWPTNNFEREKIWKNVIEKSLSIPLEPLPGFDNSK